MRTTLLLEIASGSLFLIFSLLFFTCQNSTSTGSQEDFSYPLRVGNKWEYVNTVTEINYKVPVNDSVFVPKDTVIPPDSSISFVSVDRADTTTLPIKTFLVRDSTAAVADTAASMDTSEIRYQNTPDGLYRYASIGGEGLASPKRAATNLFRFKGRLFSSPRKVISAATQDFPAYFSKRLAGPVSADTPLVVYKYPYKDGVMWDFRNSPVTKIRIDKQYLQKEPVTTPAGTYECYKVKWFWDFDYNDVWDTDMEGYDWVSPAYGLVKRQFVFRDIEATTIDPNDLSSTIKVIAKYDMAEEYVLNKVELR